MLDEDVVEEPVFTIHQDVHAGLTLPAERMLCDLILT